MTELYQYIASDYSGTGDGRTICLLITRAYPKSSDYEVEPSFITNSDGVMEHIAGTLKYSQKIIAAREFLKRFGEFHTRAAENLSKEDFSTRFGRFVPDTIVNMVASENPPGNFFFAQEFHFNYS